MDTSEDKRKDHEAADTAPRGQRTSSHPTKEDRQAALVLRLFTLTVIVAIVVLVGVLAKMLVDGFATRRIENLEQEVRDLKSRVPAERP